MLPKLSAKRPNSCTANFLNLLLGWLKKNVLSNSGGQAGAKANPARDTSKPVLPTSCQHPGQLHWVAALGGICPRGGQLPDFRDG